MDVDLGIPGIGPAVEIGVGASAQVYRARQLDLDREVAVKVLSTDDEGFVRRFEREARTLGRLSRHNGIVTVYEFGRTERGQPYLLLELCGRSLLDKITAETVIDPPEAATILGELAATVAVAHEADIIHRDLKPANVLINDEGHYLVTDFGISTVLGSTAGQTSSVGFTAGYAAPETFAGGATSGREADVYALGATFFHMLTGAPPFASDSGDPNLLALINRIANDPVPDLRPTGMPEATCLLVERLLDKDPTRRPDAAALAAELGTKVAPSANGTGPPNDTGPSDDTGPPNDTAPVGAAALPNGDRPTVPTPAPATPRVSTTPEVSVPPAAPTPTPSPSPAPQPTPAQAGAASPARGAIPPATAGRASGGRRLALIAGLVAVVAAVAFGVSLLRGQDQPSDGRANSEVAGSAEAESEAADDGDTDHGPDGEPDGELASPGQGVAPSRAPEAQSRTNPDDEDGDGSSTATSVGSEVGPTSSALGATTTTGRTSTTEPTTSTTSPSEPTLTMSSPAATVHSDQSFRITFSTNLCTISNYSGAGQSYVTPGWPEVESTCWQSHGQNFSAVAPGSYTVTVSARSADGQQATRTVTVDISTPSTTGEPTLTMSNPSAVVNGDGSFRITFTTNICTIANYSGAGQSFVTPGWPNITGPCWQSHGQDFSAVAPGSYSVSVSVRSHQGQQVTKSVTVNV